MKFTPEMLVLIAPCVLLAGVVLQLLLARVLTPRGKGILAVLSCLPSLGAVLAIFPLVRNGASIDLTPLVWDGPLSVALHVDALSAMFALMGTGLGLIVLYYSIDYMAKDPAATRFYALMLTFICGMVGLVYSANLFIFYLCWEVMGLCSFSLVGFWYQDKEAVAGSRKVLLMTHLAGYGLLAAIIVLYHRTGTALWTDPAIATAFTRGIFILMLVALAAKSVQFPLHTWIPEAMAAPTPVSALLHAACYVKAGVYLAARMHSFAPWPASWAEIMMWTGTVTMMIGVIYAMVQQDLKRMLAFSTVSQIGYMIMGIGIGTPLAIAAGLLHCLNHSFFKGGLFLAAGAVQHSAGTRDMDLLGGLSKKMPRTTVFWLISAGAMMGIPGMSGFASKWLLYTAALQAGQIIPALLAWVASVGTVFMCIKATSSVFLGPTTANTEKAHEAPSTMVWAMGIFAAGSAVLGVAPQLAIHYVINPILPVLGMATVQVTWFGLTSSAGGWWTAGGFILVVFSAAIGALVYAMAGSSRTVVVQGQMAMAGSGAGGGVGVFTGGERMPGPGRLPANEFSAILKKHFAPVFHVANVDRFYLAVWGIMRAASQAIADFVSLAERQAIAITVALLAIVFCGVRWFAGGIAPAEAVISPRLPIFLAAACAIALGALCLAALAQEKWRRLAPLMLLSGASAIAGMLVVSSGLRLGLLELSSVLALLLVWQCVGSKPASWMYLTVVALSACGLVGGHFLIGSGHLEMARALLISGFFLKLAIVPIFLWLPALAEALPALVTGLIIAVVDIAAFGELLLLSQSDPWIMSPAGLWMSAAIASALLTSFLMLSQRNLKRLLALSTIEDMGFLTLGVLSSQDLGMKGAMIGAAVHALAKALLFVSLAAPEADGALTDNSRGLASRYPLSATAFLVGMLAVLGVPPTLGFADRWRLFETAAQSGKWILLAFVLSSMFALLAYVLALGRVWWGPREEDGTVTHNEPLLLCLTVVAMVVVLIVAELWPHQIAALVRGL
jgi:NADH:ubiquinone oxidoreductase subunit 5 (subunit L)/multisubunit Na+/H+ antiporter MnhA subunit